MAVAGTDDDAPRHGATVRLHSYGLPTPELTEHLLADGKPQQPTHCLGDGEGDLPTFWRRRKPPPGVGRRVDWAAVGETCKEWITNPMNIALLLWLLCVGVSGGMFVLLLLGLLDGAFPAAADRNRWIEINNQVLNALFTLMSLYQHPSLCHHLFLLCRWRPADAADLRAAYCSKDGPAAAAAAPRRGDRAHIAVAVVLLHVTVLSQYVLCGLYWGYTSTTRPELAEDTFFVLGIAAPLAAAVYTVCSPLGKADRCPELAAAHSSSVPAAVSAAAAATKSIGHVVVEPEWAGGMFECGGGGEAAAAAATVCTCCVFGWNMERLGLGNAWVHAATFALLCFAPVWVLGVSALHIHDVVVGDAVGGAGVLLCAGGLIYGGYWRIQMRRRFGLPGGGGAAACCCGSESLTDYARWLFCWPCALAQEVRTASLYHVDGEVFYSKVAVEVDDDDGGDRADGSSGQLFDRDVFSAVDTVSVSQVAVSPANDHLVVVVHDETTTMDPPPVVQVVVVQGQEECSSSVSSSPTASEEDDESLLEAKSNREMLEDADRSSMSSDGSWRVEKVKRLINMVTLVSLLILLYTRGILM